MKWEVGHWKLLAIKGRFFFNTYIQGPSTCRRVCQMYPLESSRITPGSQKTRPWSAPRPHFASSWSAPGTQKTMSRSGPRPHFLSSRSAPGTQKIRVPGALWEVKN